MVYSGRKARREEASYLTKPAMRIKKLDHDARVTRDLERIRWFYGDVLGLPEVPRPHNFSFGGCWFRGPGFELHFILVGEQPPAPDFVPTEDEERLGLDRHIAFEIDDIEATLAHLRGSGVEILSGPVPRGDGAVQAYVRDPDGHIIEFLAWDRV
jgi:catechol 2,3-dioxygenase-like lactoylglutathione lyase family enzyme